MSIEDFKDSSSFNTFAIIEFDPKCSSSVKHWLNSKLKKSKEDNGADLLTKFATNSKNEVF